MRICSLAALAAAATMLAAATLPVSASPYSNIVVFGDSLSDNGNLYNLTLGYAPASPPYYNGRFSNGPVAVEQLASQLNANLIDYAYGGATTGVGNVGDGGTQTSPGTGVPPFLPPFPGMQAEFAGATLPSNLSSTLFVVWGGANDFEAAGNPLVAANNIDGYVQALELAGATNILVPNLPDLGATPEFYGDAVATDYTDAFNAQLAATLPGGATLFNTDSLFNAILQNPGNYGFSNTTGYCLQNPTALPACTGYLFFDDIHPTTAVDAILAQQFAAAVTTPEPSSVLLLGTGLIGVTGLLRKRRTV